jgi:hypothetical protein
VKRFVPGCRNAGQSVKSGGPGVLFWVEGSPAFPQRQTGMKMLFFVDRPRFAFRGVRAGRSGFFRADRPGKDASAASGKIRGLGDALRSSRGSGSGNRERKPGSRAALTGQLKEGRKLPLASGRAARMSVPVTVPGAGHGAPSTGGARKMWKRRAESERGVRGAERFSVPAAAPVAGNGAPSSGSARKMLKCWAGVARGVRVASGRVPCKAGPGLICFPDGRW